MTSSLEDVFEIIETRFDVLRLQAHLRDQVLGLEPEMQAPAFGGWSVLSSNGNYRDGWHRGHVFIDKATTQGAIVESLKKIGAKIGTEYVHPTEVCTGYMSEVINSLKEMGLSPRRARIIRLSAGMSSAWHRDSPDQYQLVRLHIPIITNEHCFFETEHSRAHMAADGNSYLVKVNRMHRVINLGTADRFHIVVDVTDRDGISKFHQPKK